MTYSKKAILIMVCLSFSAVPTGADIERFNGARGIWVFGGRYTTETTGDSLNPFGTHHEDNYVLGAAYSRDRWTFGWGGATGWEAGAAARFGDRLSGELWGGWYLRHRGIPIFGAVLVKPSLTLGLSVIDRAIGTERRREIRRGGNARLLYYFGPELAFSTARRPDWELVYRHHHRSGGMGTLGDMTEGHNANTIGLRRRF